MLRKGNTEKWFIRSLFVVILSSLVVSPCLCQIRRRVSKLDKLFIIPDTQSEEVIVDYQPEEILASQKPEYNYDFDFESAVVSGLTPKYSRNETNDKRFSNSDLLSSPGCPEPFEGRPWVYYGKPKKCHLSGYQWPCPQNMKLLPQRSSAYGYCACNCTAESYNGQTVTSPQSYCLGGTFDGKERILAYRKSWNGCFPLFEQGKCPDGKWLVMSTESPLRGTFCKTRKCPNVSSTPADHSENATFSFYDYRTKSCHKIGDKCQSSNVHLKEKETNYKLSDGDWMPVCHLAEISLRALSHRIGITEMRCESGQRLSRLLGNCVPVYGGGRNTGGIG